MGMWKLEDMGMWKLEDGHGERRPWGCGNLKTTMGMWKLEDGHGDVET
jgi:hypothetical protein